MLDIFSLLCLIAAAPVLIALAVIDLRTWLLPNILVLSFALLGFAFHASSLFFYDPVYDLAIGAVIGGGMLFVIRMIGNRIYDADTLGLGDVKLMAAGGLWLGLDFILPAIIIGALAGLVHGGGLVAYQWAKTGKRPALTGFSLPAGPGFIAGLVIAALAKFSGLPHLAF